MTQVDRVGHGLVLNCPPFSWSLVKLRRCRNMSLLISTLLHYAILSHHFGSDDCNCKVVRRSTREPKNTTLLYILCKNLLERWLRGVKIEVWLETSWVWRWPWRPRCATISTRAWSGGSGRGFTWGRAAGACLTPVSFFSLLRRSFFGYFCQKFKILRWHDLLICMWFTVSTTILSCCKSYLIQNENHRL